MTAAEFVRLVDRYWGAYTYEEEAKRREEEAKAERAKKRAEAAARFEAEKAEKS